MERLLLRIIPIVIVLVALQSTVWAAAPVITENGAVSGLSTTYGKVSGGVSFTVSGTNMSAGILVTPLPGIEVSTDNITYSTTITIGSAGNIPGTTVYARLSATAGAGNYSGNIVLSSPGATNADAPVSNSNVSPAPLTITADNVTKTYGVTLTGGSGFLAFTAVGLQNGETIGSVSVGYGTGSQSTDAAGNYTLCVAIANATGGTFSPDNYNINYNGADIIIDPAPLSVIANDVTKSYGTKLTGGPGSTAFTAVGLQNGETIGTVTIGYGSGSAANDMVGTYVDCVTVAAATGGDFSGHNYIITHIPGKITVLPATLIITAHNVVKTYGSVLTDASGSDAFTSTGLQNGETIGSVSIGYGTAAAANVHPEICNACVTVANPVGGTFNPDDYNITFVPGNIEVVPAPLTIIADNKLKLYGAPNPLLTVTYSGLVNGDSNDQLAAQPVAVTTATATSLPGDYPITVSGASSPDYIISYVPGILTITQSYSIPNAFTPNGDGINDTWHIQFLDSYQDCTVTIFNRLGQNLYYSNGYGSPWDGTYRGGAVPTGVYYYVITLKNINKTLSGYVTIIR